MVAQSIKSDPTIIIFLWLETRDLLFKRKSILKIWTNAMNNGRKGFTYENKWKINYKLQRTFFFVFWKIELGNLSEYRCTEPIFNETRAKFILYFLFTCASEITSCQLFTPVQSRINQIQVFLTNFPNSISFERKF